jgi:hypothetical protein
MSPPAATRRVSISGWIPAFAGMTAGGWGEMMRHIRRRESTALRRTRCHPGLEPGPIPRCLHPPPDVVSASQDGPPLSRGLRACRRRNRSGGAISGEKAMRAVPEWLTTGGLNRIMPHYSAGMTSRECCRSVHNCPSRLRADDLPPQVPPVRIACLDQLVLPQAPPALHLLFALDGDLDILVRLEPHQPLAIVLLGEAGDEPSRCSWVRRTRSLVTPV